MWGKGWDGGNDLLPGIPTAHANEVRNSFGVCWVLLLNSLLKDWGCSNPNPNAISLTDKVVVDNFTLAFCFIAAGSGTIRINPYWGCFPSNIVTMADCALSYGHFSW